MEALNIIKGFGFELTEEQESQIKKSIGNEFVSKSSFNVKNEDLRLASKKIEELEGRDFATIESERDDYKGKYESLEKEKTDSAKKSKFFESLGECKDKEYILYQVGGVDKLELDDKGEIKEVETLKSTLKESNPSYFEKVPFVVSKTDGPNKEVADDKEKANDALRQLV